MYTVEVIVKVKGESSDFECNSRVEYLHVKTVEQANMVQRAVVDSLFGLGKPQK